MATLIDGPRFPPETVPYFQQARFTPASSQESRLGRMIVTTDDGDLLAVASPSEAVDGEGRVGTVRILGLEGRTWTEEEILEPLRGRRSWGLGAGSP